jgi:hypothetical protein
MKCNPVIEYKLKQTKQFSVTAKAWLSGDKWQWNVYAFIYESHPLFSNPEAAINNLPHHCGCTFDKLVTTAPSGGNEYDSSKAVTTLKVGSDYAHLYDDHDNHPSGFDGIPNFIERDMLEMIAALEKSSVKLLELK